MNLQFSYPCYQWIFYEVLLCTLGLSFKPLAVICPAWWGHTRNSSWYDCKMAWQWHIIVLDVACVQHQATQVTAMWNRFHKSNNYKALKGHKKLIVVEEWEKCCGVIEWFGYTSKWTGEGHIKEEVYKCLEELEVICTIWMLTTCVAEERMAAAIGKEQP